VVAFISQRPLTPTVSSCLGALIKNPGGSPKAYKKARRAKKAKSLFVFFALLAFFVSL
jgi:hypothetical protein